MKLKYSIEYKIIKNTMQEKNMKKIITKTMALIMVGMMVLSPVGTLNVKAGQRDYLQFAIN